MHKPVIFRDCDVLVMDYVIDSWIAMISLFLAFVFSVFINYRNYANKINLEKEIERQSRASVSLRKTSCMNHMLTLQKKEPETSHTTHTQNNPKKKNLKHSNISTMLYQRLHLFQLLFPSSLYPL